MALTNTDLEKIGKVVRSNINEALEEVIFPKFDELEGRMDKLDEKIDGVEQRLDGVEQRLDGVEQRLDGVEQGLGGLDRRMDRLAEVVTDTRTNHERRIRRLEKEAGLPSTPVAL